MVGILVEITQRKHMEDRLRQMVFELNHRVKNNLATVPAITFQTVRRADPTIAKSLADRLSALAIVHDVLTSESWEGAGLLELVQRVLAIKRMVLAVIESRAWIFASLRLRRRSSLLAFMNLRQRASR